MPKRNLALITLLAAMAGGSLQASTTLTNYTTGDVLICFRNGGNNMVVDAGPVSTFLGYGINTTNPVTAFTPAQIGQVGVDGVTWSAFTWQADNTLFMSKPRTDLNVQTVAWNNSSSQSGVAGRMATVPPGAADNLTYDVNSTTAAIIEPNSANNPNYRNGTSYFGAYAGSYGGNWNGLFQGNTENTVSGTFSTSGSVARSDFYQVANASSGKGVLKGYFELRTDGSMVYVAYPIAVPVLQSVARSGNQTTIKFKTGLYGTYTLRSSSSLASGTPKGSWASVAALASGDTALHTYTFTDNADAQFYTITAQ